MYELAVKKPAPRSRDALAGPRETQFCIGEQVSLMTPLGMAAGEILTEVDSDGAVTLRHLVETIGWPVHLIVMALGVLVREGLVQAAQQGPDVRIASIAGWAGAAHLRNRGA
jgi:hypothetical protein